MSDDSTGTIAQQIAALTAALALPLPAETRRRIAQDLRALEAQQASGTSGTVNVTGTLHGNAVGVNYGTVQTIAGGAAVARPAAAPGGPTAEEVADQRALLAAHRQTLAIYLRQRAQFGSAYAPPAVEGGIREARAGIRRCVAALRGWGEAVADHPDDE